MMATYVLVHGGGHGGWCYQKVARLLRAAGHEAYTPTLTGLGERSHLLSPAIDLDSHITDVVALLTFEDLRDVILVGHSYGGMVITGVADRASDRVGTVVSLDAANPVNGQSLVDVAGPVIEMTRPHGQVVDGVELVLLPAPGAASTLATRDPKLTDRARAAGMLWEIDTGHDLMVTEPEAVASALLEIAAR
jgi:pimeloyl-ACP methyl ester carboxylesterase